MMHTALNRSSVAAAKRIPSFCVILPIYNEEAVIADSIRNILAMLRKIETRTGIIAVNDGSSDSTAAVLEQVRAEVPELVVETHVRNGGYGEANRTGMKAALREGFEYALVMDADGTQDPLFILDFIQKMKTGVDFIKATRYIPGSKVTGVDWRRKAISYFGNKLAKLLMPTPLTDYTNGFRAVKTSLVPHLKTTERGFSMLIEEVSWARRAGATFAEVPYELTARDETSKSKFTYNFDVYRKYLSHLVKRD